MRTFARRFGFMLTFLGFSGMPLFVNEASMLFAFLIMLVGILLWLFEWPRILKD